jgi:lysophospholipid hydrolase
MSDLAPTDRLAATPLLADLDFPTVEAVRAAGTVVALAKGETLFRQGDPGDAFFIVLEGSLEARLPGAGDGIVLERLDAGQCFGEIGVLTHQPRAATVVAVESTRVFRIFRVESEALFLARPELRTRLLDLAAQRRPSLHLRGTELFRELDDDAFARLDEIGRWVKLGAGEVLFRQGDAADALYVVVHGGLEVLVESRESEVVDVLGRGACIGEMAVLTHGERSATARAVRDSELLRLDRADFEALVNRHPSVGLAIARALANRLRHTTLTPRSGRRRHAIALVPCGSEGLPREFGERLIAAISRQGSSAGRLTSERVEALLGSGHAQAGIADQGSSRLLHWLHRQEQEHDYIVYECDASLTPWSQRALRQADLLLLVGIAGADPTPGPIEAFASSDPTAARIPRELVLLQPSARKPRAGTAEWLRSRKVAAWHHAGGDGSPALDRLARFLTGRALSVVLSGGGARGFAHIGALRAIEEFGLEVDLVGGTSSGAILGGQYALGLAIGEMIELTRARFAEWPVVRDVTLPVVSLMKAKGTVELLQKMFGDVRIEDLPRRFFCVSCNLSRAEVVVHEEGPLWLCARCSTSVPGIAPPVAWNGDLLVDGGVLNNLPVDVARRFTNGPVFALDASAEVDIRTELSLQPWMSGWPRLFHSLGPHRRTRPFPNILEILSRVATLSSAHDVQAAERGADLYLRAPTDDFSALNWAAIDSLVEVGYRHAMPIVEEWVRKRPAPAPRMGQNE